MMTIDDYERLRSQMEADAKAGFKDLAEDQPKDESSDSPERSEPAYINEGQRGYISVDNNEDSQ